MKNQPKNWEKKRNIFATNSCWLRVHFVFPNSNQKKEKFHRYIEARKPTKKLFTLSKLENSKSD